MHRRRKSWEAQMALAVIICFTSLNIYGSTATRTTPPTPTAASAPPTVCLPGDILCVKTKMAYEAIKTLHSQLDDDQNGGVDLEESEEFLREELKYSSGHHKKGKFDHFHSDDTHITVDELWTRWTKSAVHNWTVDEVVVWLIDHVDIPKYEETFRKNGVDGTTLPRLAIFPTLEANFATNILGIKKMVHRQKLALKAMDVVLFGVPKHGSNWLKDVALATSLAVAFAGCWFAYSQYTRSKEHLKRIGADCESLQQAEKNLNEMQEKLVSERQQKMKLAQMRKDIEDKKSRELRAIKAEAEGLRAHRESTETQLTRLGLAEEELSKVREALRKAERELDARRSEYSTGSDLQKLLQLTHELELVHFNEKKVAAEQQLCAARDLHEKMKRKNFLNSLRMGPVDEVDQKIILARRSMEDVIAQFSARQNRWQTIENLCGFPITNNPGLPCLITASLAAMASNCDDQFSFSSIGTGNMHTMSSVDDSEDLDNVSLQSSAVPVKSAAQTRWRRVYHAVNACHRVSQGARHGRKPGMSPLSSVDSSFMNGVGSRPVFTAGDPETGDRGSDSDIAFMKRSSRSRGGSSASMGASVLATVAVSKLQAAAKSPTSRQSTESLPLAPTNGNGGVPRTGSHGDILSKASPKGQKALKLESKLASNPASSTGTAILSRPPVPHNSSNSLENGFNDHDSESIASSGAALISVGSKNEKNGSLQHAGTVNQSFEESSPEDSAGSVTSSSPAVNEVKRKKTKFTAFKKKFMKKEKVS